MSANELTEDADWLEIQWLDEYRQFLESQQEWWLALDDEQSQSEMAGSVQLGDQISQESEE